VITRVLRTGTSTSLQADNDININSAIFGGDRNAGGGLTMTAGNNINVNDFIVTNDGAINLTAAQGTVSVLPGKALFAGSAPITINAAGNLTTGPLVTGGSLSITSLAGSVRIASFIDGQTGPVSVRAAGNVDIDEPIVNLSSGDGLSVTAGNDINVNAQVDGRGGATGGSVTMAASGNLNVHEAIVTNNGAVSLTASNGTLNVDPDAVLLTGTAPLALSARGDVTSGQSSSGALTISSAAGAVNVNGLIDSATGETRNSAATDVHMNQPILNGQSGSALTVTAGNDINVNAQVNGRGGAAGGAVTLAAGRNLNVNQSLVTNNGTLSLTAASGTATVAAGQGLFVGSAPIAVRSGADLTTGIVSGGSLSATSTGGTVRLNGVIDGSTGRVEVSAAKDVLVNQPVLNGRTGSSFNATAGGAITVNAQIDGRTGATGGAVNLKAGSDVNVNTSVITNNGAIGITATGGSATMAAGATLASGNGAISDTETRYASMQNGDVDMIYGGYNTELVRAAADPNLREYYGPGNGGFFFYFNFNRPPFDDRRMREAVIRAIDLDALGASQYSGQLIRASSLFADDSPYHTQEAADAWPAYDPEEAKRLVAEYEADGGQARFTFRTSRTEVTLGEFVQAQMAAVGIEVEPEFFDLAEFTTRVVQGNDFELASWVNAFDYPYPAVGRLLRSDGNLNYGRYSNPEVDALLDRAAVTTDEARRTADYQRVELLAGQDIAVGWLARSYLSTITKPDVRGVQRYLSRDTFYATLWLDR
jgi:hypothetical protein